MQRIRVTLTVNGQTRAIDTDPYRSLLELLRSDLGLIGVKDACGGEGECGACTVLLDGKPVNSCLVLAGQADGHSVTTIEGLARGGEMHPLQRAFVERGAVQCGFCTPGAILSALYLLEQTPHPSAVEIRAALAGNLCRCTGYVKIVEAVQCAAAEMNDGR